MLKAIPAIASPPSLPIKIMSTKLYNVCTPIPNIIGIAKLQRALDGFDKKVFKRDFVFELKSIAINLQLLY